MIKIACPSFCFCFCLLFRCCGFSAERFARLDVWHYHLEPTENSREDGLGDDAGLGNCNIMLSSFKLMLVLTLSHPRALDH